MKNLKNPGVLLTLCLVVMAIFIYKSFFATVSVDELLTSDVTSQGPGKKVVDLNNKLQTVTLDTGIFNQPSYQALSDFSTPLVPQPVGRVNPFDKI
jgi:hypothetical protein